MNNHQKGFKYDSKHINVNNVNWNNNMENNVKEIGEKAKGYKIMHIQQAHQVNKKYKWLMHLGIFLGPLAALLSGIGATLNPDAPVNFPIAAACSGFIGGIVVATTKFGKFEEKSSHHKIAASKYTSLESNVRRQLILCRNDRVNAAKYLEWIGNSFDDLFMASPLITKKIYTDYVKLANKNNITIPDEYSLTIDINQAYLKKFNELTDSTEIKVNNSKSDKKFNEPTDSTETKVNSKSDNKDIIKESEKEKKSLKRAETLTNLSDLNEFSDGRMGYEMKRMMGIQ